MRQHKHFRLSRNDFIFLSLGSFSGSTGFPLLVSLVSMVVWAEWIALYIMRCFSFCLDYMHVPYNEDKINHTLPSSIVRVSFLLQ